MCSIFKDKDQDLKLVLLFWFLLLMVGGYQGKVSLIRASLKYFHIWTKLVEAAKFSRYENHDLAIARSSSSRADSGLSVAFKCLNV